ncbi:MAG: phosphate ABC transporter ATP-binding protein [Candidatus Azobacteroides sp.]|nr:phosphate ABC transporter ATP-binding protein [Candidatus Azobacteroides sp.]
MNSEYILELKDLSVSYSPDKYAVKKVSASIAPNIVTSIIGPSGCGKTTLLRSINRLHELYPSTQVRGEILLKGENIQKLPSVEVRRRIGMVFQQPNVFPQMSIFENVISGYQLNYIVLSKQDKMNVVEESLVAAALWEEVKDILYKKPTTLSIEQQQCLCIARAIALKPEILLMDNFTFSLDSERTDRMEELIYQMKEEQTIIVTTQNLSHAARISDYTIFMEEGRLIEFGVTSNIFLKPANKRTEQYITNQMQ